MIIHSYKIQVLAVALYVFATATEAYADGTHGCQIRVQNNYLVAHSYQSVQVLAYNGKDIVCAHTHAKYLLGHDSSVIAKAHSQGSAKCTLHVRIWNISWDYSVKQLCKNLGEGVTIPHIQFAQVPTVLVWRICAVGLYQIANGITIFRTVIKDHDVEKITLGPYETLNLFSIPGQRLNEA